MKKETIDNIFERCRDSIAVAADTGDLFRNKRYLTYSVSNFGSLKLLTNLLFNLEEIGLNGHIIFSIDEHIHNILLSKNITSILIEIENNKKYHKFKTNEYIKILLYRAIISTCMMEFGAKQKIDVCCFDTDAVFTEDPYDYINTTDYDLYTQQAYMCKKDSMYNNNYIKTLCDMGIVYARYNSDSHIWYKNIPYILAGDNGTHETDTDTFVFTTDSLAFSDIILRNKDKVTVSTCYKDNKKDGFFNVKVLNQELFLTGRTICNHRSLVERIISGEYKYIMAHANYIPNFVGKICLLKKIGKLYIDNGENPLSLYGLNKKNNF